MKIPVPNSPFRVLLLATVASLATSQLANAAEPKERVAWFGTVESGLAEAKRTNKPILFVSAAPHCLGVPGEW